MRATRLQSCHVQIYRKSSLGQPTTKCIFECIFCRKKQVLKTGPKIHLLWKFAILNHNVWSGAPSGTAAKLPQLTDSYRFICKISEWRIAGVSLWSWCGWQKWIDISIHNLARQRQINSELICLLICSLEKASANFIRIDTCPATSTCRVNSALLGHPLAMGADIQKTLIQPTQPHNVHLCCQVTYSCASKLHN